MWERLANMKADRQRLSQILAEKTGLPFDHVIIRTAVRSMAYIVGIFLTILLLYFSIKTFGGIAALIGCMVLLGIIGIIALAWAQEELR
ncbi:hypothetical protein CL634_08350 [bacterium]|nr:hypothetical protein [bacterium]